MSSWILAALLALAPLFPVQDTKTPAPDTKTVSPDTKTPAPDTKTVSPDTETVAPAVAWPMATSDIPVDGRMHFGLLDNGLKYAWMANPEPDLRSYVRLHVNIGSTVEQDAEQGMAHFLEHMAFNGSENFAAGELIKWFQNQGMDFGAHVNASTGFDETIYKLDMPESDAETLGEALRVMRDYASGLLLESEQVEAEIGVIDGEQRERDSVQFRIAIEALRMQFDGTAIAQRIPIGVREVREEFTAETVRAFYERWYRPENMTLVIVGDLGQLDPTDLIAEFMGGIEVPEADRAPVPSLGEPTFDEVSYALYNDEIKTLSLRVSRLRPYEDEPLTVAEWVEDAPLWWARRMLNLRFSELARKAGNPFLSASVGGAGGFEVMEGESLSIACDPGKWRAALMLAEQELRRAIEHGFQQPELDEVRGDTLLALDESVERQATRSSRSYLGSMLTAAKGDDVPTDAATNRKVLKPVYDALTLAGCHAALREAWATGELAITSTGGLDLGADGIGEVLAVYEESREVEVEPMAQIVISDFAYATAADDAAEIAGRELVEDMDITQVVFGNGVRLNVKRTDFKQNEVLISARFGEGSLPFDDEQGMALRMACEFASLTQAGTGEHSIDDLRRLTAGRQVSIPGIGVDDDHFTMSGSTNPDDALLQMELMAAYFRDPGWRDDSLRQVQSMVPLIFQQLQHQAMWPIMSEFFPALHDGDPRVAIPSQEEMVAVTMDQIRAWAGPQLSNAPIEVSVVGDIDVDVVVGWAARTFGALPERREARSYDENRTRKLVSGLAEEYAVPTEVEGETVQVFYPTTDGREHGLRRRLSMLARVLGDRLRETIREELGEAYSPSASSEADDVYPDYGMITVNTSADTGRAADVLQTCLEIGDSLAEDGVTDEELNRLREPVLKSIRDAVRRNGHWMGVLSRSQTKPGHLDGYRSQLADYEGMTTDELSELARRYLGRDNASSAVVRQATDAGS